ncbi:MAG: hypothetical protein ACLFS9_00790 [Nitriliruptoraceae bacterium]
MDGTRLAGLVLIGVGATLLLMMATDLGGEVVLLALGFGFLLGYAVRGLYGLLVAGAILTGLGGGAVAIGQGAPDGAGALGLGVGFLLIAVVDRIRTPGRGGWWWPFIPGGILVATALPSLTGVPEVGPYLVPATLVLVGVLLLLRPRRRDLPTETASATDPPPPPPQA